MTPGLWGVVSALSWGTADFITRFTGRAVGYVNALFGMLLISSVFISLWLWLSGGHLVWTWSSGWLLVVAGIGMLLGTLFLYMSLTRGPVTLAAPITGSYPAIVVAIAVIMGSRPSVLQWVGMAVTLAGVAVVASSAPPRADEEHGSRRSRLVTAGLAAVASVAFAVVISATQVVVPIVGSLQTLWLPRVIALVLLSVVLAFLRHKPAVPKRWWPALTAQAGLDVSGYFTLYVAAGSANPEIAAMTSSAYYVVTVILGWILLREHMPLQQILGIVLVFAGVLSLSA